MEIRSMGTHNGRGIGLFLVLTFALSAVFYTLIIATGHVSGARGLYVTGLMWSPGVAAMLACRILRSGPGRLGWSWGAWRWQWLSYLLPLGYALVAYLIIWGAGFGGFGNADFQGRLASMLGWANAPVWLATAGYFLLQGTIGMTQSLSTALGEEIGWRGFLAPALVARLGFTGGALLTGLIWGIWHLPILLFADYNAGTPWWFALPCFMVLVLSMSVVMTWLRLRSGSLWTAALVHASHNLFIQTFFTPMTAKHGDITPYAIDEFGFVLPLVTAALAVWFWSRRGELTRSDESHESPVPAPIS
jgi:membrane protease YdiL (CAAX protease family)